MVAARIAEALAELGHEVTVLTKTEAIGEERGTIRILRSRKLQENLKAISASGGVVIIEMSLKWWVLCKIAGTKHLVTHHTHPFFHGKPVSAEMKFQRFLASFSPSVACSRMIAREWGKKVGVLPNPYDQNIFRESNQAPRDVDFVFAGRLIKEKGVFVFLKALVELAGQKVPFTFAILGDGPQLEEARAFVEKQGLSDGMKFLGSASQNEVAGWFNRSRILVIPSVWQEPFGLIAIEGLGCGVRLICSDQEGLREASGNQAVFFPSGDHLKLTEAMAEQLQSPPVQDLHSISEHLSKHHASSVAAILVTRFAEN